MTNHGRKYGEQRSRPIYIWNGILEPKHLKKLGPALSLFLWLIDRTTREHGGLGAVLGGKPLKADEIAASMGVCEKTTLRRLDRLEQHGYIERTLAPYGYVIRVKNSCKFPKLIHQVGQKCPTSQPSGRTEVSDLRGQKCPTSWTEVSDVIKTKKLDEEVDEAKGVSAAWRAIGTERLGTARFRSRWEFFFNHRDGNPIADTMERCIIACQESRIPVPKPFYDAKRIIDRRETEVPARPAEVIPELEAEPWAK